MDVLVRERAREKKNREGNKERDLLRNRTLSSLIPRPPPNTKSLAQTLTVSTKGSVLKNCAIMLIQSVMFRYQRLIPTIFPQSTWKTYLLPHYRRGDFQLENQSQFSVLVETPTNFCHLNMWHDTSLLQCTFSFVCRWLRKPRLSYINGVLILQEFFDEVMLLFDVL